MNYVNNATLLKRELMVRLAKMVFEKKTDQIDRLPSELFPKNNPAIRCCVHKDRAVTKYRLMALMGHRAEDEVDELRPLSDYYKAAMQRQEVQEPVLTVLDDACSSCVKGQYFVSNACQGCVARPCMLNCRKEAVSMENGRAKIDAEKCVNCGICMQECPYHAIIYIPVPCEEACPVDAISKDENGKEQIDFEKCIFCGKCMRECPFGAITERSQLVDVLKHLTSDKPLVAMMAPAIVGQFSADMPQIVSALKQLGFDDVVEVAHGADATVRHETAEFAERVQRGEAFMTTSCCPSYTEAVNKHMPNLKANVSDTATPMHYTAQFVRSTWPDSLNVFIGPCVAKRHEALNDKLVDFVLSFEELGALFIAKHIDVQKCAPVESSYIGSRLGRGFPISGGVTEAIKQSTDVDIHPVLVDGLTKKSLRQLKGFAKECPGNFVEVMACEGGCMAGPNVICNPRLANKSLQKLLSATEDESVVELAA